MLKGCWVLVDKYGNNSNYYTRLSYDKYIHKQTKMTYLRGKRIMFRDNEIFPKLIDDTDEFEYIINKNNTPELDIKAEILAHILFKK